MNRAIAMLIIGLVFGAGIGFVLASSNEPMEHNHATDHGPGAMDHSAHMEHHNHDEMLEVSGTPSLDIHVFEDPVTGWNVHLMTSEFRFSPENSGLAHIDGEGHAHIYANGAKLGRVYGEWVHIDKLPEGEVTIEVTLNSNDHRLLAVDGKPLKAEVTVAPSGN